MSLVFAVVLLLVFAGALAQGSTGVGLGLVATPFVAVLDPGLVPGPMLVPMVCVAVWTSWRDRRHIDLRWALAALGGRLPGAGLGAWLHAVASFRVYAWLFAGSVIVGVLASLLGPRITPSARTLFAGGFGSGLMGTLTSIGGPPIMLVVQHGDGPRVRATLSAFFSVGSLISILALALFGSFGARELWLGLSLVPAVVLGAYASQFLTGLVDRGLMRPVLLTLAALAAPLLVARALVVG